MLTKMLIVAIGTLAMVYIVTIMVQDADHRCASAGGHFAQTITGYNMMSKNGGGPIREYACVNNAGERLYGRP